MNAIRICNTIESDTLHLPELRALLGRTVEIIVLDEAPVRGVRPGTGDWAAFERLAGELEDYDFDAQRIQDEADLLL
jgi:hypothetical protein